MAETSNVDNLPWKEQAEFWKSQTLASGRELKERKKIIAKYIKENTTLKEAVRECVEQVPELIENESVIKALKLLKGDK